MIRARLSLLAAAVSLAPVLAGAQPFVQTERGPAMEQARGAVLVYDARPGPALQPMAMPPVSQAYLRAQKVPVLPKLGPAPGQPAAPVALPQGWPRYAPTTPAPVPVFATPAPVAANPYLRPVAPQPVWQPQPVAQQRGTQSRRAAPVMERRRAPSGDGRYVDGIYAIKKDYLLSWPENVWRIVSAPARWDRNDWLTAGAIAGVTGALIAVDKNIKNFWQADVRSSGTDDFFDIFEPLGDFDLMLAGSMGSYLVSELFDARREKAASLMLFQAVAIGGALGEGFKHFAGRTRPEGTLAEPNPGATKFNGFDGGDNDSFPSGHAIVGFATATVIAETYAPTNPWVPWVAYPTATLVAMQRINKNRHWASDTVLGAALGHFIARLIVDNNPFLMRNNIALRPMDVKDGRGVTVSMKY